MTDIAISVKNLSKKYQLYDSPQHRLKEALHPFRKKYHRDFWALKDVSFEVKKGESLGIIGKNGSGKSTLLQILCGVLQKTTGEVVVNGKVSALLELGAGFNPELTGRENVYMNGAIMGFNKEEMDERIEAIIEFADIGEFIDQPVKIYSSGMFVRLAFACAINVDPEILVIDEALSVGDLSFQAKCLKKIRQIQERGITIILVSHDLGVMSNWCENGLFLNNGQTLAKGDVQNVIKEYRKMIELQPEQNPILKNNYIKIKKAAIEHGEGKDTICPGNPVDIYCDFETEINVNGIAATLTVFGPDSNVIALLQSWKDNIKWDCVKGSYNVTIRIDSFSLIPGKYGMQFRIASLDNNPPAIADSEMFYAEVKGNYTTGIVHFNHKWNLQN